MRVRDLLAWPGGAFPIVVGYAWAPSPKYDPGHWGPCDLSSVFPVMAPEPHDPNALYLDWYECVYEPSLVVFSCLVLGAMFVLSGVFAALIAKSRPLVVSAVPAGITVAALLLWMTTDREFLWLPTVVMGVSVWLGAMALAALGAFLTTLDF
jgi:hypothetical protein